jgi:hypothetical protein
VVQATSAWIEVATLRAFVSVWRLAARWGSTRIVRWAEVQEADDATFPQVTRVIVSGHGTAEQPGATDWSGGPRLSPGDLARVCPNARTVELWVCYQGRHAEAWAAAFGSAEPRVVGRRGTVLGPFPVPEWLANAASQVRRWLRL